MFGLTKQVPTVTTDNTASDLVVTEGMIQAACVAGYGVGADKNSNLYKVMRRALTAALAERG